LLAFLAADGLGADEHFAGDVGHDRLRWWTSADSARLPWIGVGGSGRTEGIPMQVRVRLRGSAPSAVVCHENVRSARHGFC